MRGVRGASGPVVGPQLRTHVALVLQDLAVAAVSPEAADVIIVQDLHLQTSADVRVCTELGDWGGLPEKTPAFTHGIGDAQNTAFCSRSPAPCSDSERELVFIVWGPCIPTLSLCMAGGQACTWKRFGSSAASRY